MDLQGFDQDIAALGKDFEPRPGFLGDRAHWHVQPSVVGENFH